MPRGKQYTIDEKAKIQAWMAEDLTFLEMASRLKRDVSGVRKMAASLRQLPVDATPPPAKARSGRPRVTTPRQDEKLRQFIYKCPFKTAKEVKREVPGYRKLSVRRIQAILKERLKIPSRAAAAKPLLTEVMCKKRIRFAKRHLRMSEDDWEEVMFSDEATFRLVNPRAQRVRRASSMNRYLSKFTVKTVKHPPSMMVWACFTGKKGRGSIYFLPQNQTMNSERYRTVLEEKVFPWMKLHKAKMFLQDGAPCHKSKATMALLKTKEDEFKVFDWPGNSPDLNPIENV